MDVRTSFIIAIGVLLFTIYYLEKEMKREDIYLLFAGLSVIAGVGTAYLVANKNPLYEFFITFTVLFILIAILYHDGEESGGKSAVEGKKEEKKAARQKK